MLRSILTALLLFGFAVFAEAQEAPGVFVRFQLLEPANASWHVRLGGYIHVHNWYLPKGTVPEGADKAQTVLYFVCPKPDWDCPVRNTCDWGTTKVPTDESGEGPDNAIVYAMCFGEYTFADPPE